MSKVTVGCRLPTGIILRLADGQGNETQVELKGQNADMNGAIFAEATESKTRSAAKERVKEKTGLEGVSTDGNGVKKVED